MCERRAGEGDVPGDASTRVQHAPEAVLRYVKLPPELATCPAHAGAEGLKAVRGHLGRLGIKIGQHALGDVIQDRLQPEFVGLIREAVCGDPLVVTAVEFRQLRRVVSLGVVAAELQCAGHLQGFRSELNGNPVLGNNALGDVPSRPGFLGVGGENGAARLVRKILGRVQNIHEVVIFVLGHFYLPVYAMDIQGRRGLAPHLLDQVAAGRAFEDEGSGDEALGPQPPSPVPSRPLRLTMTGNLPRAVCVEEGDCEEGHFGLRGLPGGMPLLTINIYANAHHASREV